MKRECLNCKHYAVIPHFTGGDVTPPDYEERCAKGLNYSNFRANATTCPGWEEETDKVKIEMSQENLDNRDTWEPCE